MNRGWAVMDHKSRATTVVFFTVLLFMLATLMLYAYLGTFTRYMADDYTSASVLKKEGFWGAQLYWWQNWSGRYSFTFVISLIELFGLGIVPILPTLIILLWLFSITWLCLPFLKDLKAPNFASASIFVASVVLWLTYRSFDDYPQIVFWQTGILTYPISPILFLLGVGIAVRCPLIATRMNRLEFCFWFVFAFIAGGFSETGVITQIALLAFLLIFLSIGKKEHKSRFSSILWSTLCGSILSLLVISLSPGNLIRSGSYQNIPPVGPSILGSLMEALVFIPRSVDKHTSLFVFGFFAGVFLVFFCLPDAIQINKSLLVKHFAASLIVTNIGIWAGIMPAYVLRGGIPPERVLLFSKFLTACLVVYWGALSALFLQSKLPKATHAFQAWLSLSLLVFLIALGVIPSFVSQLQLIPSLEEYAELWDKRHASLILASQNDAQIVFIKDFMKVEALRKLRTKLWLTGDFETSSDYWINRSAAQYYDVDQIVAE